VPKHPSKQNLKHNIMADLFPYITEEVQKAINTIAITMREHNFNGSIAIAPEIYAITEADGQLHYYRTNPLQH
jgi:hypothetical protein